MVVREGGGVLKRYLYTKKQNKTKTKNKYDSLLTPPSGIKSEKENNRQISFLVGAFPLA